MADNFDSPPVSDPPQTRRLDLFTMFRLGLFQMGLGMLSLLTLGVLNQVMISELKVPGTIAGFTLAMYQFVLPARVCWRFGYSIRSAFRSFARLQTKRSPAFCNRKLIKPCSTGLKFSPSLKPQPIALVPNC